MCVCEREEREGEVEGGDNAPWVCHAILPALGSRYAISVLFYFFPSSIRGVRQRPILSWVCCMGTIGISLFLIHLLCLHHLLLLCSSSSLFLFFIIVFFFLEIAFPLCFIYSNPSLSTCTLCTHCIISNLSPYIPPYNPYTNHTPIPFSNS